MMLMHHDIDVKKGLPLSHGCGVFLHRQAPRMTLELRDWNLSRGSAVQVNLTGHGPPTRPPGLKRTDFYGSDEKFMRL
jgi:hypothetical protein